MLPACAPQNVANQLLMGDDEPDMGRKPMQQGVFLARQLNAFAFERHHARHQIDRQPTRTTGSRLVLRKCRRSAASLRARSSAMPNGLTT